MLIENSKLHECITGILTSINVVNPSSTMKNLIEIKFTSYVFTVDQSYRKSFTFIKGNCINFSSKFKNIYKA